MMKPIRLCLTGFLFIICQTAVSQTEPQQEPKIVIGGDVYGGGRQGAVGTAKTTDPNVAEDAVVLSTGALTGKSTTNIVINDGQIRTVFGGGQNGRTFGATNVTVNGGTVGGSNWEGSIHGGIFGAGDGKTAVVFGNSVVTMQGGTVIQNIYGGGNEAPLIGTTAVTLKGGDIQSTVYGGARVADIHGYTLLHIDGADAKNDLIIKAAYGGNDIAGNISIPEEGNYWSWIRGLAAPAVCTDAALNGVNGKWNAFVASTPSPANNEHTVYVGQLFGGGNGDYQYGGTSGNWYLNTLKQWDDENGTWKAQNYSFNDITRKPEVRNVYLELKGGIFGYVYGGGNKATVTNKTVICLDNTTKVEDTDQHSNKDKYKFSTDGLRAMGINLDVDKQAYDPASTDSVYPHYQFDRVFGGNKQADMAIQPDWKLIKADINSLYSGGDAGNMTNSEGLLLAITSENIKANNVYGGCRIANVQPTGSNIQEKQFNVDGKSYTFPEDLSARVLITNGTINNVYGGNDISGTVYGGSALEILHSINGEVYGGGNGSYVYTDNPDLETDATYGDFYYNPGTSSSIDALNAFRPNTSKTYIHLAGTDQKPITVKTVYGGGNSTTVSDNIRLRLGTYVTVENIFLGSNGVNMKSAETLQTFAGSHNGEDISSLDFKDGDGTFDKFMLGTAVTSQPVLEFDNAYPSSKNDLAPLAKVGSFYCGGNVGSMTSADPFNITFNRPIVITNKIVGGCNTAYVAESSLNDEHYGGFTGGDGTTDKIQLNIDGVIFTTTPQSTASAGNQGNIFGGCFESGKMVGNVKINLKENIIPSNYFADEDARNDYLTDDDNLFETPLSVFGGGFGEKALIEGTTTVNVFDGSNNVSGAALKVFGGGYGGTVQGNTTVNLYGENTFIGRVYGGGFEGPVIGSTAVNLDGGTVLVSFGGSCNAKITGSAQTYLGAGRDVPEGVTAGMTTILGNVYGGNDFGDSIKSTIDFKDQVSQSALPMVYNPDNAQTPYVVQASSYVEYQQANIAGYLFGGSCGRYDYATINHNHADPYLQNAFVNFRPLDKSNNDVKKIFGAGEGYPIPYDNEEDVFTMDQMQDRSYVLIDIDDNQRTFDSIEVFGSGAYSGLGMRVKAAESITDPKAVTAVVDLVSGGVKNVYGASYNQGVTRRTLVRVPDGSTINVKSIFGGGYGQTLSTPCDAIEANIEISSTQAIITSQIYGGNNNARRTLYSTININSKVHSSSTNSSYTAGVYGGGLGANTWSQYTTVNMNQDSEVYYAYGGGDAGNVLNKESFVAWKSTYESNNADSILYSKLGGDYDKPASQALLESNLTHLNKLGKITNTNVNFNLGSYSSGYSYGGGKAAHVSGTTYIGVHGGIIAKDIYGAGEKGDVRVLYPEYWRNNNQAIPFTAETNAYIEGGSVRRIYGGGWQGNVGYTELPFKLTEAEIKDASFLSTHLANDVPALTNVVIGIDESEAQLRSLEDDEYQYNFYHGIPTVEWNAYGAGERGGVVGKANLTMNNGYVGYRYYKDAAEPYQEKLDDETAQEGDGRNYLIEHGNLFGSGFDDGSYADSTNVEVYGGIIRNSVYGGGEIAAVGRGQTKETGTLNSVRQLLGIAKAGATNVEIYGGQIHRNAFGGGKGYSATRAQDYAYSDQKRYTDGYVFGQTAIYVHGGIIGTDATLLEGDGNVFGGGNIGYVYTKDGIKNAGEGKDGYYYDSDNELTEDCKVVVSPYCKVNNGETVSINSHTYKGAYIDANNLFHRSDYIPIDDLNSVLSKTELDSKAIDGTTGIIIQNAVFAGGNVSQGSDLLYAEATTVFGNATASVIDLFCKDLITLGQEGIGGLYGDGNLTFVDGYRELNITNYGTDYWNMDNEITYQKYLTLNDRERAYFRLQYRCIKDTLAYTEGKEIYSDEYDLLPEKVQAHFEVVQGVCSIYAGRMMNTVQRADYCGVFGSRMVMRGARDRVPAEVDYTNYTINRVGEVGLHKSKVSNKTYGSYFGIYNIVHYLGALTSDLQFDDEKEKDDWLTTEDVTYYEYKSSKKGKNSRNEGISHNEVALASGVYLELLQEPKRNYVGDEKIYGPITGVIQLNLIAASTGEGGGYVYAKNEHGTLKQITTKQFTLAAANEDAVTYKSYEYNAPTSNDWMQSSGNFVSTTTIIDDCFPNANSFNPQDSETEYSPAHYWFIKGDYYVYNQEISAYTGSAQAYTKNVNIPLTILAQGNGELIIEDIQTCLYADSTKFPADKLDGVICDGITYRNNDPISYWAWSNLSSTEKNYFVTESYVCVTDVYTSPSAAENPSASPAHKAGEVFTTAVYQGNTLNGPWYNNKGEEIAKDRAFRLTNALSHENGYMLAVSIDQPIAWDEYYTHVTNGDTIKKITYNKSETDKTSYVLGPTYHLNPISAEESGTSYIFGQSEYKVGDLIDKGYVDRYNALDSTAKKNLTAVQAEFEPAYMALTTCDVTIQVTQGEETTTQIKHVVERSAITATEYNNITDPTEQSYFVPAYYALETVQLSDKKILSGDQLYSLAELNEYATEFQDKFQKEADNTTYVGYPRAYYCSKQGSYGGTEFASGRNYQAAMYANLNAQERSKFSFNYDALDLMLNSDYPGKEHIDQYDKPGNAPLYSTTQRIDYKVRYTGTTGTLYGYGQNSAFSATNGQIYSREQFERLANEKRHYVQISTNYESFVEDEENVLTQNLHIVTQPFSKGRRSFNIGDVVSQSDWENLDDEQAKTKTMTLQTTGDGQYSYSYNGSNGTFAGASTGSISFYLCTDGYNKPNSAQSVATNAIITENEYNALKNYQADFDVIAGIPQEKSALYVSRDCDIYDFTGDRIFTIIYRYSYAEPNEQTNVYKNVSERHILNIRVHFESGEPIIGELLTPETVMPGTVVGLFKPSVQKGAFEVLGGGWELYENENNAITHKNGVPYDNYITPMYWYQDGWYVAYYAETYLGRTFSNAVPFNIANYHDMADVMADTTNHMHIDHPGVKANSRIYIDNRQIQNQDLSGKSELDLLYDLYDLSLQPHGTKPLLDENNQPVLDSEGHNVLVDNYDIKYNRNNNGEMKLKHSALNDHVKGLGNLEIILNSNVQPKYYSSWHQIGTYTDDDVNTNDNCFEGTLHGNGYTISGIDKSLFGYLCGEVFNLGVRGTIAGAGISDYKGYAQNCWLINDAQTNLSSYNAILNEGTTVNCYYNDEAATNAYVGGAAISKPMGSFLNGEVAYNLNGFYLNKRLKDHDTNDHSGTEYYYYCVNSDNTLSNLKTGYASDEILYVENYYKDGEFVYAGGTIPTQMNERHGSQEGKYYPIYPDDYIYFGQKLTYDMSGATAHDAQPKAIRKTTTSEGGQRIDLETTGNRVFRAPAYYGSSTMGKAYFNSFARFADTYQGNDVYAGMTAIDFTGDGDASWTTGVDQASFFKPLLDYSGLKGFNVKGLTKNLLVYVDNTNDHNSYDVLERVLLEPAFTKTNSTYATVSQITAADLNEIKGHLVKKVGTTYQAAKKQFLVDLQDFNAPISYTFSSSDFMWYQRTPGTYVESMEGGWETVSLPFTTEVVTTQDKGELTHFYSGSIKGHEYWLREFNSVGTQDNKTMAMFQSLAAGRTNKNVTNTFLWDYYYNGSNHKDANSDSYIDQSKTAYSANRPYTDYPLASAGKPYLIGFPGSRYYEFDLSGSFEAAHTANPAPDKLGKQIITFVSINGQKIGVTDTEYADSAVTAGSYTFHPIYQAKTIQNAYTLKADGTADDGKSFNLQASGTTVPFRTYMTAAPTNPAPRRSGTSTDVLYIGYTGDNDVLEETIVNRGLNIYGEHMNIIIESTLDVPAHVSITTTAGRTLKQLTIQPGTKVTVPVNSRGIYIVNRQKIAVTK